MYVRRVGARLGGAVAVCICVAGFVAPASAQDEASDAGHQHQHDTSADQHAGHDMSQMHHDHGDSGTPMAREGSGTSWLPDDSPMYAIHTQQGPWQIMF